MTDTETAMLRHAMSGPVLAYIRAHEWALRMSLVSL